MTLLTVQSITPDGVDLDALLTQAVAAGDSVANTAGLLFKMKNADSGAHTLTLAAPVATAQAGSFGEQAISDIVIVVSAGESKEFTVPAGYADQGLFSWDYDDDISVSIGVFALAPNS